MSRPARNEAAWAAPPLPAAVVLLLVGVAAPILLLWLVREDRGQRPAGACVLAGVFLFNLWWIGGGLIAAVLALMLSGLAAAAIWRLTPRGAHYE